MGILDLARRDTQDITENSDTGFAVEITLTAPTGEVAVINGLHTKHHLAIDTDGNQVHSKNAHISFSEYSLDGLDYPLRNSKGEVDLTNHKVFVKDSTGLQKKYVIRERFPDETVGLIVCILAVLKDA